VPQPKTLHYPLDSDRYLQASITSLDVRLSNQLLPPCDLHNPILDLILFSNKYRRSDSEQISAHEQQIVDELLGV